MKVYILTSATSSFVFTSVLETSKFWIAPYKDGCGFDQFGKDVFTLTVEEAKVPGSAEIGFDKDADKV